MKIDMNKYTELLGRHYEKQLGQVTRVVGLTMESLGPDVKLDDLCMVSSRDKKQNVLAEVIGFRDDHVLLMPFEEITGVGIGSTVENLHRPMDVKVGEKLLGQVLDGLGKPLQTGELELQNSYPVDSQPPDPLQRKIIDETLVLGVKAVDGLITIGKGQRIGIFAGSGVG